MIKLDNLDRLFITWAFLFQIALIAHYALRKPFFENYTLRYGWIVYALCIPAFIISIILLRGEKRWAFWTSGFLFVIYAVFGYWVDYIAKIQFRSPLNLPVLIPYVTLYLATIMFYWWPILRQSRPLWGAYTLLYVIATMLVKKSH